MIRPKAFQKVAESRLPIPGKRGREAHDNPKEPRLAFQRPGAQRADLEPPDTGQEGSPNPQGKWF